MVNSKKLAVMEAVEKITTEDMAGFYEGTSYLFVWILFWNFSSDFRILWFWFYFNECELFLALHVGNLLLPQLS